MTTDSRGLSRRHLCSFAMANIIVIVLCLISLVPMLLIGVYDRPSADDFAYSLLVHRVFLETGGDPLSIVSAAVQTSASYYQTWQGLYTSAFLLSLQPGIAGSSRYPVGAYLIIAFIIAACLYLAMCIERRLLNTGTRAWPAVGFLLATFFIQAMPFANEGIYWYNGAANYTPIFFSSFFTVGLCITALTAERTRRNVLATLFATVLSFVVSGGNYSPAFFNLMLMFGFAVIAIRRKRPYVALPFVASAVGFAISAMAPGTAVRQGFFEQPGMFSTIVHSASRNLLDIRLFCDFGFMVLLVLLTFVFVLWVRRTTCSFTWKRLALGMVAAFLVAAASLCVPYYAMWGFGEGRVRNIAFFTDTLFVMALWLYAVGCLVDNVDEVAALAERTEGFLTRGWVALVACAGIAAIVFFGSMEVGHGNALVAARSVMSGEAQSYAAEYDARDREFLEAVERGDESVTVEPLSVRPRLLFFSDIVGEDDWSGTYAEYYGISRVEVLPGQPALDSP